MCYNCIYITDYLQKYCPLVERLGFDENFLDVTDLVNERLQKEAKHLDVKGHVFSGVQTSGILIYTGISSNPKIFTI